MERLSNASGELFAPADTTRGIVYLCVGLFIFSIQDIIIKWLSTSLPVHEIVFVRGLVAAPLIFLYVHYDSGYATLMTRRPWLHALRAGAMFVSYMSYYLALASVPLTTVVSLFFVAPLMITALAIPILGERVGWRRWMGVGAGLLGVLIILRPGFTAVPPAALLAILSAFTYSIAQLVGRRLGATDSASVMSFYMAIAFVYLGGAMGLALGDGQLADASSPSLDFLLRAWTIPPWFQFGLLAVTGVISAVGFVLLTQAYRIGEANKVAPFEYTVMIWATLLSFIFFGTVPDLYTLLGASLIAASGIYVLYRERINKASELKGRGPFQSRYASD